MASSHPPSLLVQPSRPTTALNASHSERSLPGPTLAPQPPHQPPVPRGPIPNLMHVFSPHYALRGTVRIRVEQTTFYCHREILAIGSPFFEALLLGDWKETAKKQRRVSEELAAVEEDEEDDAPSSKRDSYRTAGTSTSITSIDDTEEEAGEWLNTPRPRLEPSTKELGDEADGGLPASEAGDIAPSMTASYMSSLLDDDWDDDEEEEDDTIVCSVRLREEKASSFQDFLCHLYPRLELLVTWQNAGELLRLSSKFDVPSLRSACIAFLLPSCAGQPVKGMKISEDYNIPELYKEASRYTLDGYANWPAEELATLSEPTLLKLERKRSWFLERLLKLGLVQVSRDYTCVPSCPDPALCAKLVNDKWSSAWNSAFRFNTPQPSIVYRSLRQLEPSLQSPALHLPMTLCQDNARLFIADLFDRMFSLSITPSRGWSALTLNGTMSGSGGYGRTFGPGADVGATKNSARYFLFVEMHEPSSKKERPDRLAGMSLSA